MADPAQIRSPRHRIDLTREEIELSKLGPLSAKDSERLLEYLEREERDQAIEAWLANPVGPIPWPDSSS